MINRVTTIYPITNSLTNLIRLEKSLILLKHKGKYILEVKKHILPSNYSQLIGGNVNNGFTPLETSYELVNSYIGYRPESIEFISTIKNILTTSNGETKITTHIFFLLIPDSQEIKISSELKLYDDLEFQKLIFSMSQLQNNISCEANLFKFNWKEYAQMYEPIHQIAYNYARNKL